MRPVRLTCTDHRIIEILGLRPSNRLPVSYYQTTIWPILSEAYVLLSFVLAIVNVSTQYYALTNFLSTFCKANLRILNG